MSIQNRRFLAGLLDAAEEELAEASSLLDLAEHRFDDVFAQAVAAAASRVSEFPAHGRDQRASPPILAAGRMLGPAGGHVAADPRSARPARLASEQKPLSAETSAGLPSAFAAAASSSGSKASWSEALLVRRCARMTCALPSTAACAL
jgi:hypothetical protein